MLYVGVPNTPMVTGIAFNEKSDGDVSVTWRIETHELRPVHRYILLIQKTETKTDPSKPKDNSNGDGNGQDGDRDENSDDDRISGKQQFNVTINEADVTCKLNETGNHCKHILEEDAEVGTTYIVIVCAENEFGRTCGDPASSIPVPAPLVEPDPQGPSAGVIAAIVIVVLVVVLLCCLLWILLALFFFCYVGGGREKKYHPEKRG